MKTRLVNLRYALQASYWLTPALLVLAALALAAAVTALDGALDPRGARIAAWTYGGSPQGARALLSTIAASVIGLAGVTFSITIVALTLASTQFGPRLLRSFMADRGNQVVLGVFVATFLYNLMVLGTVRDVEPFVPHLSITVGILLAIVSVGVLIYFIHHTAASIQADAVIAAVASDLERAIDRLIVRSAASAEPDERPTLGSSDGIAAPAGGWAMVEAGASGYCQAIDYDALTAVARERDAVIRLTRRAGQFVAGRSVVAAVHPGDLLDEPFAYRIRSAYILGRQRTPEQDVEFTINQLVEVAVRALSPGINDPFTAIGCVDWLSAALCRLAAVDFPESRRYDEHGRLRLIIEVPTFGDLTDAAFNQIRQAARTNVAVSIRLLEALATVAPCVRGAPQREALLRQATLVHQAARGSQFADDDCRDLEGRYAALVEALRAEAASGA